MGCSLRTTNAFTDSHVDTQLSTSSMSTETSAGGGIDGAMENAILQCSYVGKSWATANTISSVAGDEIEFRGSVTGTNGAGNLAKLINPNKTGSHCGIAFTPLS